MLSDRPVIRDLERSGLQYTFEAIAMFALAVIWGFIIYRYPHLPASIPRHFDAHGEPDAWGNRFTALTLPIASLAAFALFTVIDRYPHRFNYPWIITERNARIHYQLARELVAAINGSTLSIFAYIEITRVQVALGTSPGLGRWFLPVSVSLIFTMLAAYFIRGRRAESSLARS